MFKNKYRIREGVGIKQGVLTVKTSLAHVFPLFNKYFLRTHSVPGPVSITCDRSMNKTGQAPCSQGGFPYQRRQSITDPMDYLIFYK